MPSNYLALYGRWPLNGVCIKSLILIQIVNVRLNSHHLLPQAPSFTFHANVWTRLKTEISLFYVVMFHRSHCQGIPGPVVVAQGRHSVQWLRRRVRHFSYTGWAADFNSNINWPGPPSERLDSYLFCRKRRRVHSHQAKAKKIKEPAKEIREKNSNIKENVRLCSV